MTYVYAKMWEFYPALFYGLAFLIGMGCAQASTWSLSIPLCLLFFPLLHLIKSRNWVVYGRFLLGIPVVLSGFLFIHTSYDHPELDYKGVYGDAYLNIHSLSVSNHHFGKAWLYKGSLSTLKIQDTLLGRNIPITVSVPYKGEFSHPPANCSYIVHGRLKRTRNGNYTFIVNHNTPWYPVKASWSLAEMRHHAKEAVKQYINNHISLSKPAKFLNGLAVGEFDDRIMAFELSRFGLQHLMAISGFHFGIIAYFLSLLVRSVMPYKFVPWILIVGLTFYFLFLGISASVMRSWIGAVVFFGGQIFQKECSGLNALGLGLLAVLMIDPMACKQVGFQFSFATTAAILLFHSPALHILEKIWPKRTLGEMIKMDLLDQHAYVVLSFFKQGVALTMAVTLVAFPITLYYFSKFPLLSLIYNLFFPFMVSLSMILLMIAILVAWIPPLSNLIHAVNTSYTEFVLNFTYNIPTSYDVIIYFKGITKEILIIYLALLFFGGLTFKHYYRDEFEWNLPLP